jgi:Fic-DOC domain mobile mystery protein B
MVDLFRSHLGNTPLSDDEKHGLIPSLATQRELNEFEYENIVSARVWALSPPRLARAEILNASYLLSLHARMFDATWRWAGQFRTTEKTIGVEPHRIVQDLATLLGDVPYWIEHHVYPEDEIALRFHHRLVFIHPFVNGNGRHARLAADLLALKLGRPAFAWGHATGEPTAIRQGYLAALRRADQQDYTALLHFARSGAI